MLISFAYTTPSLLARAKTVTRREWKGDYPSHFWAGQTVQAWDKSPRFGGRLVADIRLTEAPHLESILTMPDSDYAAEGFEWLSDHKDTVDTKRFGRFTRADFDTWRHSGGEYWVIRFEVLEICESLETWLARRGARRW